MTQPFHFCEFIQRNPKHQFERTFNLKEYLHLYVHCSIIRKQPKCPSVDELSKKRKLWYIYALDHYLSTKKKETLHL